MNPQQLKSIDANLKSFCDKLSDDELTALIMYIVYDCTDAKVKPNAIAQEFIEDFFGQKEWNANQHDEIIKPEFFNRASMNTKEIIRLVRVGLMQESFWRVAKKSPSKPVTEAKPFVSREEGAKLRTQKPKEDKLSTQDKKNLRDILNEHKAMLEYQLEDEKGVKSVGGQELVDEKKRHVEFIDKFGSLKLF